MVAYRARRDLIPRGVCGTIPMSGTNPRPVCTRCRRPLSTCWCVELTPIETTTRVVFLQHSRENRVAIGTARMAHLGLARSELYVGIDFAAHGRIQELIASPGAALLFPGEGSVAPDKLEKPPTVLLVIDGTWPQARKLMALNPALGALPRIGFVPRKPGNYRIRREPAVHCVATIEAVVEVLAALEGDETRFASLIRTFDGMVERQIACAAARKVTARRTLKPPDPWWASTAIPDLDGLWPRLIAIVGESNAHGRDSGVPGSPELVQLAAIRLATWEVFGAFLAPRRPLAPGTAQHLDVPRSVLVGGRPVGEVLAEWNEFHRPDDRLLGWGSYGVDLLAQEGWRPPLNPIDLRVVAAHRLKRAPGSVTAAAAAVGADLGGQPVAPGRAGRTLQALAALAGTLRNEAVVGRRSAKEGVISRSPDDP